MKKDNRGILVYLICILTILYAVGNLAIIALDVIEQYNKTGDIFYSLLGYGYFYLPIKVILSLAQISTATIVIGYWKKQNHFLLPKELATLISVIIYVTFIIALFNEFYTIIYSSIVNGGEIEFGIGFIYIAGYVIFSVFVAGIGKLIRKRKLIGVYVNVLFASLIALAIAGYEAYNLIMNCIQYDLFAVESALIEIAFALAIVLITFLCFIFTIMSISYYNNNPAILDEIMFKGRDYDVLERNSKYEILKIYSHREKEGAGQVFTKIIYVLAIAIFGCGITYFAIENDISQYFVNGFNDFISNLLSSFMSLSLGYAVEIVKVVSIVFFQPLMLIGLLIGIFKRDPESKATVFNVTYLGLTLALFTFLSTLFKFVLELVFTHTLDISNYTIWEVVFLVIYIVSNIVFIAITKKQKETMTGLSNGLSYSDVSKKISKITTITGIFSIICLGLFFLIGYIEEGIIYLSYPLMAVATLFLILGAALESKFPCSEFDIVKRKIITSID